MEINDMSVEELNALMAEIQTRIDQITYQTQQEEQDARARLAASISTLDALIGPDNPTEPALDSLTEVRLFTQEDMQTHSGLAHALSFYALEIMARAMRDIAMLSDRV